MLSHRVVKLPKAAEKKTDGCSSRERKRRGGGKREREIEE